MPLIIWWHKWMKKTRMAWFVRGFLERGFYFLPFGNDPKNMHIVCAVSCFVVVWFRPILPISFRVTSLTLGQSQDCPSASEAILKRNGQNEAQAFRKNIIQPPTMHSRTMCISYIIYRTLKRKFGQTDDILVIGCTVRCQYGDTNTLKMFKLYALSLSFCQLGSVR